MTAQQGRRELGNPSVFLFHPPTPSCQDSSITGGTLQGDARLRTTLEETRVSARRGWAGEKVVIFRPATTNTAMLWYTQTTDRAAPEYRRACRSEPQVPA